MFITTKYSTTISVINRKFEVKWTKIVEQIDCQKQIDYCTKEDTRVPNGVKIMVGQRAKLTADQEFWQRFLLAPTVQEGLAMVRDHNPLAYIKFASKLEASLTKELGRVVQPSFNTNWILPLMSFSYPDGFGNYRQKTLVFIGGSGIGKTNFALSHFDAPCHITGAQGFDQLGISKYPYDGVVIDDYNLSALPWDQAQNIVDNSANVEVNVKYGSAIIKKDLRRIVCANSRDFVICPSWPMEKQRAIERRCVFYDFGDAPLWRTMGQCSPDQCRKVDRFKLVNGRIVRDN